MDKSPDIKADIMPTTRVAGDISRVSFPVIRSMLSYSAEPIIMGMESKKEKVVASSFPTPCKRIADIVAPLLDTPGKTAIPCKTPVNILVLVSISAVLRNLKFSPAYNKHAVKTNPQPSSLPSISDGASNLKTNASTTVGTHARIIYPLVLLIG